MKNVFLLGDIYNEISEELYNEKLSRASRFEQQKQIYFDEIYKNNNSKATIYNVYKKNILNWELILNKDLYEFDIAQLDELISSIPSSSIHIKASVYSFCNQYLNYCISKRIISMNNIKALPRDTYTEISQKLASSRLISYKQFWDIALMKSTRPELSIDEIKTLHVLLPRTKEEQQQIADYLDAKCSEIDSLIADKKRQLDILADYKKSLIYEYVTGKKEVPVNE